MTNRLRQARPTRWVLRAFWLAVVLVTAACTGSASDDAATTTTEASNTINTIDTLNTFVDACRTEQLQSEPDVERLAFDPTITNLALGLLTDEVGPAAAALHDCLGDDAADYLAADLQLAGQTLPDGTAECFRPFMAEHGDALLEVSIRRVRLEESPPEIGSVFVDTMLECVPGRFLAAPIRTENPAGYAAAVDEECLDAASESDPIPMTAFLELQTLNPRSPDPSTWTEELAAAVVAPLYECIVTGDFIAADPDLTIDLSAATRECFTEAATANGYWETRVAQRPFDEAAYQAATDGCLTPEEALVLLGTPLPADDPEASNFTVVDDCYTDRAGVDDDASLLDDLADGTIDEVSALSAELLACAEPDGVAGRYAATRYNNRALPQGSYDCFSEVVAQNDAAAMLEAILSVEAGFVAPGTGGDAYITAFTTCVPPNIYTRPILRDYSGPGISSFVDADCIDAAYPADAEATATYWQGLVFGGLDDNGVPTALATEAVAAMYDCVNPGQGFASVVADRAELLDTTIQCMNDATQDAKPIETALIGAELPEGTFNGALADCLTDPEVEDIRE
jgi:hypothetical protein